jgi:hypothetical protein
MKKSVLILLGLILQTEAAVNNGNWKVSLFNTHEAKPNQENTEQEEIDTTPPSPICRPPFIPTYTLEESAAWFYPLNEKFREIYGNSQGIFGIEANFHAVQDLYLWSSFNFLTTSGKGIGTGFHPLTTLYFIPIEAGLKYLHNFIWKDYQWGAYLGVGASANYLHIRNSGAPGYFPSSTTCGWGFGMVAKTGGIFYPCERVFVDLFFQYSYAKVDFDYPKNDVDLSGLSIGAGVGYAF